MKFKNLLLIAVLISAFGCGSESKDNDSETGTVQYFSNFVSHEDGKEITDELSVTLSDNVVNNTNFNYQDANVKMKLDKNGTYFLYAVSSITGFIDDGRRLDGQFGEWTYSGEKMILDNLGETFEYDLSSTAQTNYNYNYAYIEMSETCFSIQVDKLIELPINGNIYGQFNSNYTVNIGDVLEVCR